jgi:hypothetical protein
MADGAISERVLWELADHHDERVAAVARRLLAQDRREEDPEP